MGEWVPVGKHKDVPGQENNMERRAGHMFKAGLEVEPAA